LFSPKDTNSKTKSIADVFIFESLTIEDEASSRFEGLKLADMLRLAGKNPKYYYFQSFAELTHLIALFRESGYRYLHISSHASATHISSAYESISYSEFAAYFNGQLKSRRVFVSACQIGNKEFVEALSARNKGMHSVAAPRIDIQFDHAAALWSAFYISMFSEDGAKMNSTNIQKRLEIMMYLFPVEFFLATFSPKKREWRYYNLSRPDVHQIKPSRIL
jgi:hypothetical protein